MSMSWGRVVVGLATALAVALAIGFLLKLLKVY
jgi:ABC-type nitrate/sulfonate/bicarbonate transport system permease component